ncbi:DNA glycosylase AlkZ-like family protein [Nocardioides hwasunensis]|uniref:Winged helix DNA-binding domain-containing protein n=1 Tax=Nocardioides hwasunensis TaxID=397258 RepID=A0ABR8MID4_9ACTN|nr:crosslink repair DNA glycosylase YcaQ family protein [Nocardioides hwasunensis]MBD3915822.1 winged helix DNA-binding domain-containing protein [Nocardioides hwasunensis]
MSALSVSRSQALTWRLRRQHLTGGSGAGDAVEVVRTLAAVSVNGSDPDLAVRRRLAAAGEPGEVGRALADGRLMHTFSFRGSVQVMAPETAGAYLALRSAGRQWALTSWVEHYRLPADEWPDLRALVRDVVAAGPVHSQAIADAVSGGRWDHLAREFAEPNITLLKPFAWQGDIALAPSPDGSLMLQDPAVAPGWAGVWPLEEAGPWAVLDYVSGYGPTTPDHVEHWLGGGLSAGRSRLTRWWSEVADRLTEVEVDGERRWLRTDDADELADTRPEPSAVLLPGKDDWVMGPGTKDTWVVPAEHRTSMTRGAHPVVVDGVVAGTWRLDGDTVDATCDVPGLADEAARLGGLMGRELSLRTP